MEHMQNPIAFMIILIMLGSVGLYFLLVFIDIVYPKIFHRHEDKF